MRGRGVQFGLKRGNQNKPKSKNQKKMTLRGRGIEVKKLNRKRKGKRGKRKVKKRERGKRKKLLDKISHNAIESVQRFSSLNVAKIWSEILK